MASVIGPNDISLSSDVKRKAFDRHPISKLIAMPTNRSLVLHFIMLSHISCAKIVFISYMQNTDNDVFLILPSNRYIDSEKDCY